MIVDEGLKRSLLALNSARSHRTRPNASLSTVVTSIREKGGHWPGPRKSFESLRKQVGACVGDCLEVGG